MLLKFRRLNQNANVFRPLLTYTHACTCSFPVWSDHTWQHCVWIQRICFSIWWSNFVIRSFSVPYYKHSSSDHQHLRSDVIHSSIRWKLFQMYLGLSRCTIMHTHLKYTHTHTHTQHVYRSEANDPENATHIEQKLNSRMSKIESTLDKVLQSLNQG